MARVSLVAALAAAGFFGFAAAAVTDLAALSVLKGAPSDARVYPDGSEIWQIDPADAGRRPAPVHEPPAFRLTHPLLIGGQGALLATVALSVRRARRSSAVVEQSRRAARVSLTPGTGSRPRAGLIGLVETVMQRPTTLAERALARMSYVGLVVVIALMGLAVIPGYGGRDWLRGSHVSEMRGNLHTALVAAIAGAALTLAVVSLLAKVNAGARRAVSGVGSEV